MKQKKIDRAEGMTFIELTIMIIIIGILVTLVGPGVYRWIGRTNQTKTQVMLRNAKVAITQFKSDTAEYPNTLYDLVFRPADARTGQRWQGPYVEEREIEMDGFGNEIMYHRNPQGQGKRPYELYSWGANGEGSPQQEWIDAWSL